MTAAILVTALSLAGGSPDDRSPGFDYELMSRITAKNNAKRARYGNHTYDPETWLPVPEKKPEHPRPYRRDDTAVRQARMQRAALRRQRQAASASTWWVVIPTPNPRCPFASVVMPVSY